MREPLWNSPARVEGPTQNLFGQVSPIIPYELSIWISIHKREGLIYKDTANMMPNKLIAQRKQNQPLHFIGFSEVSPFVKKPEG